MKIGRFTKFLAPSLLFGLVFIVYFGVGSRGTFKPPWGLDYFNPLAQSLRQGRLDLAGLGTTYDLSFFQGKWYAPWGILPALLLIAPQILVGRFVPVFYLALFFSGLNVAVVWLLLKRIKKEFLPNFSNFSILLTVILFAFGTSHFYVGTLPSVWHVEQIISVFPAILGIYFVSKKKRQVKDYFLSISLISMTLLAKANLVLLVFLPILLCLFDIRQQKLSIKKASLIGLPIFFFSLLFFLYNFARFGNPLENGYSFIKESPHFAQIRQENGIWSLKTIPRNLWYMVLEMPALTINENKQVRLNFNLEGNSIFFLTPPLLAIFLAVPQNFYIFSLWLTLLITLIPILMIYSTGWMQFGYRYSVDFLVILILLSVFGIKRKITLLYFLGIVFAIWMQTLGIKALQ